MLLVWKRWCLRKSCRFFAYKSPPTSLPRDTSKITTQRLLFKVLSTLESFARGEICEIRNLEYHLFVHPLRHVFLPLGNWLVWIVRVAIWLRVWVDVGQVIFAQFLVAHPPIMHP